MIRRSILASLLPLAALGACGKSSSDGAPSHAPSSAALSASAAPSSSAAQSPMTDGGTGFYPVALTGDPIFLYPLGGALFTDASGILAQLGDGPFVQSPGLMKGLEKGASGPLFGTFPTGAWLVSGSETYKWVNDRWAASAMLREGETLLDITAWDDARALAAIGMKHNDMRFLLVGGKSGVIPPAPGKADPPPRPAGDTTSSTSGGEAPEAGASDNKPEGDDKPEDDSCKVKMKPERLKLAGLPSGHLFAVGYTCKETGSGPPIAERWEPKKVRGVIDPLPVPEGSGEVALKGVLAVGKDEAYAYGSMGAAAYVAAWDGKAWTFQKTPFAGKVLVMRANGGALFAVAANEGIGGKLYKKPKGGEWAEVRLPEVEGGPALATDVWPKADDDVWVAVTTSWKGGGVKNGALLRSKKADKPVLLTNREEWRRTLSTNKRFKATRACDKLYAHLATLGPSKAPDGKPAGLPKGFPALKPIFAKKEFASLSPIVEDDGAHLYIGVPVPSYDVGELLVAEYMTATPNAQSALFCHEPIIIKQAIKFE